MLLIFLYSRYIIYTMHYHEYYNISLILCLSLYETCTPAKYLYLGTNIYIYYILTHFSQTDVYKKC